MKVYFEVPNHVAEALQQEGVDLSQEAKEAFLVEMFRFDKLTHHELEESLALSSYETDGVLKRHEVATGPTLEQHRASAAWLRGERARS